MGHMNDIYYTILYYIYNIIYNSNTLDVKQMGHKDHFISLLLTMEQFNSQPACRLVLLYEGRHDYNVVTFPVDTLHPLLPELTVGYQGVAFCRLCLQWAD